MITFVGSCYTPTIVQSEPREWYLTEYTVNGYLPEYTVNGYLTEYTVNGT